MAGRHPVADPGTVAPASRVLIDQYLAELAVRLHGPKKACAAVVEEVRGGLADAVDGFTARGMTPSEAAKAALVELGTPARVAAAFRGELATVQARRILWTYLITGPLVGIWWLLLLVPQPWEPTLGVVFTAIPVLPLIAAAVAIAVVAIATTGSLIRWLPETAPRRAIIAACVVAGASMVGDLTVFAILVARMLDGAIGALAPVLAVVAAVGSGCRLAYSVWVLRRSRSILTVLSSPRE